MNPFRQRLLFPSLFLGANKKGTATSRKNSVQTIHLPNSAGHPFSDSQNTNNPLLSTSYNNNKQEMKQAKKSEKRDGRDNQRPDLRVHMHFVGKTDV
jgi:hypothetical protein